MTCAAGPLQHFPLELRQAVVPPAPSVAAALQAHGPPELLCVHVGQDGSGHKPCNCFHCGRASPSGSPQQSRRTSALQRRPSNVTHVRQLLPRRIYCQCTQCNRRRRCHVMSGIMPSLPYILDPMKVHCQALTLSMSSTTKVLVRPVLGQLKG